MICSIHFTLTIYTYITEVNYFFQKSNSTNCNEIRNNAIELLYLDYHKKINYPEKLPLKLKYPPDSSRAKEAREPSVTSFYHGTKYLPNVVYCIHKRDSRVYEYNGKKL
uniref:Uncharacterized protein n=1 Tax=Cacopsylla melanoneura TaxID=428564 RepID=A0A8D8Z2E9_9HEMI